MVVRLALTRGRSALVDDEAYALVAARKWQFNPGNGYAETQFVIDGKQCTVKMHRFIMGLDRNCRIQVDHINHDALDNRRANLRLATNGQNQQNKTRARIDSLTGVRGVRREPRSGQFLAYIWIAGKRIQVGRYACLKVADEAVREARRQHYTHAPECLGVTA